MTRPLRAPRLEEVAALAGVSAATVSRYLNNPGMVAASTGERIRRAVEDTGYLPNMNAGALASSRSRLIAALVPDISQSIFNDTIEAMIDELSNDGNSVMMSLTGADNNRLIAQINAALSRRVDAIILTGIVTDAETRDRLRSHPLTVIETWGLPDEPIDVAIGFSHSGAGDAMAALDATFIRAIAEGRPELIRADYAEAVRTLAVTLAADRSARTGQPVEPAHLLAEAGLSPEAASVTWHVPFRICVARPPEGAA